MLIRTVLTRHAFVFSELVRSEYLTNPLSDAQSEEGSTKAMQEQEQGTALPDFILEQ